MTSFLIVFAITRLCTLELVRGEGAATPPFEENDYVLRTIPGEGNFIPGEYLMLLNADKITTDRDRDEFQDRLKSEFSMHVQKHYKFGSLDLMYAQTLETDVAPIRNLEELAHVSQNRKIGHRTGDDTCERHSSPHTWGLDRIDQRERTPMSEMSDEQTTYTYSESDSGEGVYVYIVDSGVDIGHPEFEGRAVWGYTAVGMDGDADFTGHGTHVAGTVSSRHYGVAKKSNIIAVKVLNCTGAGSLVSVFDGLHWALEDHREKSVNSTQKSVINMSIGWEGDDALYKAIVTELVKQGINVAMAAGNERDNACLYNPVKDAITVGAIDKYDRLAQFSNWGECVDIFAPGVRILSTYSRTLSQAGVQLLTGTSMATPHVSGVVARYLSTLAEVPSPYQVKAWILKSSSKGYITFTNDDLSKSPNRLLFMTCY